MCSATGSRGSNPLVWLVFVQRPSLMCGASGGTGSNPVV